MFHVHNTHAHIKWHCPPTPLSMKKYAAIKKEAPALLFFRPESYTMAAPLRRKLNKMFRINSNIETNISNHKPNENIFDEQMERPPGIEDQKKNVRRKQTKLNETFFRQSV